MVKDPGFTVSSLLDILESDEDFRGILYMPVTKEDELERKYRALRSHLESRLRTKSERREVPQELLWAMPGIYIRLAKHEELLHPVPRHEFRMTSALPAILAEVIIHFVDFKI